MNFNFRKQFAFDGVAEVGKEREVVVKEKFPERVEIFRVPRLSSLGSEEIGKVTLSAALPICVGCMCMRSL